MKRLELEFREKEKEKEKGGEKKQLGPTNVCVFILWFGGVL